MRISGGAEQQPTSAERVLAILASAHSMTMVADGRSTEVSRGNGPGATQHVHLHPSPADAGLTGAAGTGERVLATLKFTDVAPLPVRDRVRARVTVMGWLTSRDKAASPAGDCMEFATAVGCSAENAGRTRTRYRAAAERGRAARRRFARRAPRVTYGAGRP
ncbi:hypothetical protein [Streptomyces platensis]|uniref:hypothetical protein n=1 Tax=Streptomyces platensis TaxID=58346 RepID=UPI003333D8BC